MSKEDNLERNRGQVNELGSYSRVASGNKTEGFIALFLAIDLFYDTDVQVILYLNGLINPLINQSVRDRM